MKQLPRRMLAVLGSAALALAPQLALADNCQMLDPGCYIDDFTQKQLYQFNLGVWQINRGGLVAARWLEDLRVWLTDLVFVNAFTSLAKPVQGFFALAMIVFWMVFVVSHMVQGLLDLNWVNLRRAMPPVLFSLILFSVGGDFIKWSEQIRLMGGNLLQQTVTAAVAEVGAPDVPLDVKGDESDMPAIGQGIYVSATSCKTLPRTTPAVFLSDYTARYLWANAEDIHCNSWVLLPSEFMQRYYPNSQDISGQNADVRARAIAAASQGAGRQGTGILMMMGAVIEQLVQLIFAVALAIVWFGLLISLVFSLFLPTESLFISQVKAGIAVVRASLIASFMIGLGLAILGVAATSRVGAMVFVCGMLLIATVVWQGKQALGILSTSLSAANAVAGSAPGAVGGMLRSWGTTAALVAGTVATGGGLGAALTSVGSTMVRRAGRSLGDNPLSEAAGRVMTNRVADRLDALSQNAQMAKESATDGAALAWYDRLQTNTPEETATVQRRMRELSTAQLNRDVQLAERKAAQARSRKDFRGYEKYKQQADDLRAQRFPHGRAVPTAAEDGAVDPTTVLTPEELARTTAQVQEADGDTEQLRTVLQDSAAAAVQRAQLKAIRNRALREKDFPTAKQAIRGLRVLGGGQRTTRTRAAQAEEAAALTQTVAALSAQVGQLEAAGWSSTTPEARAATVAELQGVRQRLLAAQDRLGTLRPAAPTVLAAALTAQPLEGASSIAVAQTAEGLRMHGHAVQQSRVLADGGRIFHTTGGVVALGPAEAAQVLSLPVGQALRVATTPVPAVGGGSSQGAASAPVAATETTSAPAAAIGTTPPLTPPAGAAPARRGRPGPRFSGRPAAGAAQPSPVRPAPARAMPDVAPTVSIDAVSGAPPPAPAAPSTAPLVDSSLAEAGVPAAPAATGAAPAASAAPMGAPAAPPPAGAPTAPQVAPTRVQTAPVAPQIAPAAAQVAPTTAQVAPAVAQVSPAGAQAAPADRARTPAQHRATTPDFTLPAVPPMPAQQPPVPPVSSPSTRPAAPADVPPPPRPWKRDRGTS